LLLTSNEHPVAKNVSQVRAEFPSAISLVGSQENLTIYPLLATSDNTHVIVTPTTIDLSEILQPDDKTYFNTAYVPVAVSLEGIFDSNFANRMMPKGLQNARSIQNKSVATRQIIIANSDIIRNETNGIASDSTTLPLGFDRYTQQTFGNKEFLQNAVLYLTDNEGWMELRSRTLTLRLLNKQIINNNALTWQLINTMMPILILAIFGVVFFVIRWRKFQR
jgi:hypothetical protein